MREAMIVVPPLVQDLEDDDIFRRCLGKEEHFRNFEKFFLAQIRKVGYQYLFEDTPLADDMKYRMYMGKPWSWSLLIWVPFGRLALRDF
jgi:hypothetical protein